MRLTFLLDENIIYHAIRGVDKHDQPDPTAQELVTAIARICHLIALHPYLIERYTIALEKLGEHPPRSDRALNLLKGLIHNSSKLACEYDELPCLPKGVQLPREDEDVVRTALISKPVVVTNDSGLRDAINNHHEKLGLKALDARGALELAESEKP